MVRQNGWVLWRVRSKLFESIVMILVDGQHIRQFPSVACNSHSDIVATLQTVGPVARTQRHRLDADKFPMFSGALVGLGKNFVAIYGHHI